MTDIELTATLSRGLSEACHLLAEHFDCPLNCECRDIVSEYTATTISRVCGCDEYYCPPKADCWYRLFTRNPVREVEE